MTGVIWFVQVVHYPLMGSVGRDQFVAYENRHTVLTTIVVAFPMIIEALTALLLTFTVDSNKSLWWANLILVGILWGSTFFLQVPQHGILSQAFDEVAHQKLVSTNWVRTIAWTIRAGLVLYLVSFYLK